MKLHHTFLLCAAVLTAVLTAGPSHAAENKSAPNAQAMLNNMRLKQLTKALELTTEQQAKVKALYESESEQIAKIDAAELPIAERTDKVTAVKK
jgi:Spy/CpxP family protein refolding chaperone